MFKSIIKLSVATAVSLGMMGSAALASSSITGPTGAFSNNQINNNSFMVCNQAQQNNVGVFNFSAQGAKSGKAVVIGNTGTGDVSTGKAGNSNNTNTGVAASNTATSCPAGSGAQGGSISGGTGAFSNNQVNNNNFSVQNTSQQNNVGVANVSVQGAKSGKAVVIGNTGTGDVSTGSAGSSNSTVTSVVVSNN